jgi:hypothetical protein
MMPVFQENQASPLPEQQFEMTFNARDFNDVQPLSERQQVTAPISRVSHIRHQTSGDPYIDNLRAVDFSSNIIRRRLVPNSPVVTFEEFRQFQTLP